MPLRATDISDHTDASFTLGAADAPWEGIGTGWFYSVLGGGKDLRPSTTAPRVPVTFDNTAEDRMRGDYPVPTVFNGDFDVVTSPDTVLENYVNFTNAIPGWSLHNSGAYEPPLAPTPPMSMMAMSVTPPSFPSTPPTSFIELNTLATTYPILGNYLTSMGSTGAGNYALELQPGRKAVHNNQRIPESGMLRFDVFAPTVTNPSTGLTTVPTGVIKVYLDTSSNSYELKSRSTFDATFTVPADVDTNYPAVDLRTLPLPTFRSTTASGASAIDPVTGAFVTPTTLETTPSGAALLPATAGAVPYIYENALDVQAYFNRLAYGASGFETFLVDVPDTLRNQSARLRFVTEGTVTPVYIDNIGFGSVHLTAGNPTLSGQEARRQASQTNNYLVEKSQYALSYNASTKNANWVSWQLNNSWLGGISNKFRPTMSRDITLRPPNFTANPEDSDYDASSFSRGHLTPASDRSRNLKDYDSTFILSNILPQSGYYNSGPWSTLEQELKDDTELLGRDIYTIAGGYGSQTLASTNPLVMKGITIPSHFWKVALVLDQPNRDITTVSDSPGGEIVDVIAVIMGNELLPEVINPITGTPTLRFPSSSYHTTTVPGASTFPAFNVNYTYSDEPTFRSNWEVWRVPIDHVEALTGLDLLSSLPDDVENRIEANEIFTPY